ncbi:hypothetical protein FWK35_00039113, partial [Aphis craccivora]
NRFGRKLVLRKNSRFSITFLGFFLTLLKTIGNFLFLTPQSTNYIHFPTRNRVHFLKSEHFYCSKTWLQTQK